MVRCSIDKEIVMMFNEKVAYLPNKEDAMAYRKKILMIVLSVTTALIISMPYQGLAAKYTFTFATHATPDSFRGRAEALFLEEVERITNGQVAFKIFWGESLMKGNEILKGVADGVVDSGIVNINFFAKQLLYSNALNTIQEGSGNYKALITFFNRTFKEVPELSKEFAKFNSEIMYIYGVMNATIVSTKPISSVNDLKGMKARSASRWQLALFKELGAQPVSVPWSDCTMALQTNVIDAVYSNIDAINMVKMEDAAPNLLIFEEFFPSTPYVVTMNSKKFKALPAEIQAKFREAGLLTQSKLIAEFNKWYAAIREKQTKAGYKVKIATAADYDKWLSLPGIEANKKQWVKEASDAGAANAQAILDNIYKIFHESRSQAKSAK